ncbi:MAG: alpha,2-mannosyltransferase [Acidobacteriota bacterium]|nr:alpha,2-mannosyltransferase [Acidobacteriota bacterium]
MLVAGLVAIVVATCCAQQIRRRDADPEVFVGAARLLLHGQDIYLIPTPHGSYYYYPPFFAFLNIPLVPLPIEAVIVLWALASIALLGWSMAAFYSGLTGQPFFSLPVKTRWTVCFFSTLLTTRFIILHLRFGQSNIFVMALAVAGLTWLVRNRRVRGGALIALSIVVKLTTLPFAFWFFARRSSKVLLGMFLGGLLGVMLPALVAGVKHDVDYHRDWIEKIARSNDSGTGNWANTGNISLRAQADRFFLNMDAFEYHGKLYRVTLVELSPMIVRLIGRLAMLSIALVIGLYAVRFRRAPELISEWGGFAFVFSLIPNFTPVSEIPHLVLLLPAHIYVVHLWHVRQLKDRTFRTLVVLSFVFNTMTTNTVVGMYMSRLLTSLGCVSLGLLLLSSAIFRAAICFQRDDVDGPSATSNSIPKVKESLSA